MTRETVPMNAQALNTQFLEALNLDSWTEERVVVDEDEITRRMEGRGKRIASMMVWRDLQELESRTELIGLPRHRSVAFR
jgi:hypothetical protein